MKKTIAATLILIVIFSFAGCSTDINNGVDYSVESYRTTMQYYDDFKILQLTDLHFGIETDVGEQLDIVRESIRKEKPDLIILTGDNFMYASKGIVKTLVNALNEECKRLTAERGGRLTKFTMTFGNHDNQGDYPRYYINEVISSYCAADGREIAEGKYAAFVDFEDDNLFGLTNFYIDLVDDRAKGTDTVDVKYRLHIIDSNTYHFVGPGYKYDVIHSEQLSHAKDIYEGATADRDYIGMAFFHIPFYEYEDAYEQYLEAEDPSALGQGKHLEGVLYPYENNGSFAALREANIVSFVCGNNHRNYGDIIYTSEDGADRAILSFGVKGTNQLYHDKEMIGYKTITLRDISAAEFVSAENIKQCFKNYTGGYANYEER